MDGALIRLVWLRAGNCCEYCRMPQEFDEISFEIDHIIAKKHKGPTVAGNLALSCSRCNAYKGSDIAGRDSWTRKLIPLFNPRRHK
ncbi:MAG: HNH endonuclease [Isosphaeraceae bacterium]